MPSDVYALLLCDESNFMLVPFQRDALRKYAKSAGLSIAGEIIYQIEDGFDPAEAAQSINDNATERGGTRLLISATELLNESGIAAHLLPLLEAEGKEIVGLPS